MRNFDILGISHITVEGFSEIITNKILLKDCSSDNFITYNVCSMILVLGKNKTPHNFGSGQCFLMKLSGCVHLT